MKDNKEKLGSHKKLNTYNFIGMIFGSILSFILSQYIFSTAKAKNTNIY